MSDRRRCPRLNAADVSWCGARLRPGRDVALIDIGDGGALVEGRARLLPGTRVVIQLFAPHGAIAIRGQVLRCEVSAIDPQHGVRYRGALSFDTGQNPLSEGKTHSG